MRAQGDRGFARRACGARLVLTAAALGAFLPGAALAQSVDSPVLDSPIPLEVTTGQLIGVLDRPRPEYDAVGAPVGAFTFLPKVQVGTIYTSNVYGSSTNAVSDGILTVDPSFELRSNWSRNALRISSGGNFRRFFHQTARNENGYFVATNGQIDISPELTVFGTAEQRQSYEPQYESDTPNFALSTIRYHRTTAAIRTVFTGGRFRISGALDVEANDYDSVKLQSGTVASQSFRDRLQSRLSARVEYAVRLDSALFVEANVRNHNFSNTYIAPGQLNRDGTDYRVVGGIATKISTLARAWVGAGFIQRDFKSSIYPTISGFAYDAKVSLYPSGLTTLTFRAKRDILDSATTGSGYFADDFQARVDHELLRAVLLYGQVDYEHNSFRGLVRTDNIWQGQAGVNYLLNRRITLSGGTQYVRRTSTDLLVQPYNEWRGIVAMTLAL